MQTKRCLPGIFAALGMLILILDSKTALIGAQEGLTLCIRTVIPSLFPFFVLSGILVHSLMGASFPILRPLERLLGIPAGAESLLISGFLGGYPVGAKAVHDAWISGQLDKQDAQRMLSFCSNAGPSFLFGMAAPMFSFPSAGWVLWGIHIASALIAGILFRKEPACSRVCPANTAREHADFLSNALTVTGKVCAWVILFRVLCCFLQRWFLFLLPKWAQCAIVGLLELANGCIGLFGVESEQLRFLLCSVMLSFGGVCVAMQTFSVAGGLDLSLYFAGKLVQSMLSLLLSAMYLGMVSPVWLVFLPLVIRKKKGKSSSILHPLRV